jgi:hypothetical protein
MKDRVSRNRKFLSRSFSIDGGKGMSIVRSLLLLVAGLSVSSMTVAQTEKAVIDLSGSWTFRIDRDDRGIGEQWFLADLPETIILPGSMTENGKGDDISVNTHWYGGIVDRSWYTDAKYAKYRQPGNIKLPFWLTPSKHYIGAAWYRRSIEVPDSWRGKRIVLFLERPHWETRLWVDGTEVGFDYSLATPHQYDLSDVLTPGRHRLTLRIDNRIKAIDVGDNAHSITDHTQTDWNGVVGAIRLEAGSPLFIDDVRTYPDVRSRSARVVITVKNLTGKHQTGEISVDAGSVTETPGQKVHSLVVPFDIQNRDTTVESVVLMGDQALLWDEFSPSLYSVAVVLHSRDGILNDRRAVQFGMREIHAEGGKLVVNGRPVFLRGTLECCVFPRTGYPAMDVESWARIFAVCKAHGLNHMRFHSWCPPEAAFDAADRAGIYLQVECCAWCVVGDGAPIDAWLYQESERIVKSYGNHPSFCMMAYGNEPGGENQGKYLSQFVEYWKTKDSRRVYTSAAGWPILPPNEYLSSMEPRIQVWGAGLKSIINRERPQTIFDFSEILSKDPRPMVSHEVGQWCAYPDFSEIPKYTGVLKARNFEIFRDDLDAHHMGDQAHDFLIASGKLQALCYKADVEAALRTPGMAGFQLLGLSDFPGQGTALVGVLNAFWEEKGYISPSEFRRFCSQTVPLARLKKMSFANNEPFEAGIEVAHFGPVPLKNVRPAWSITDQHGKVFRSGTLAQRDIAWGNAQRLGTVKVPLNRITKAAALRLSVRVGDFENGWDFWVYPSKLPEPPAGDIMIVRKLDDNVERHLRNGGSVLLALPPGAVRPAMGGNIAIGFSSIFWNTAWTSRQPPHTLGILCNPRHPALKEFPTEAYSNWQWWDAMSHSQAMILDQFPSGLRPIVQVIDDWTTNHRLGLVFEARVGKGKLLVSSIDLWNDLPARPEARQMLYSLRKYMASSEFEPTQEIDLNLVKDLM